MGGLDVAVNCAGIDGPAPLADLTPEVWRRQIDVNLSGTFYVAREAALRMRAAGTKGVIINLGSELSLIGMGWYVHYCASKFGVVGLTKALAHELAPDIRVNCICPGPIDTPMMDAELDWFPDPVATRQAAIERVPLKRFATADEVARAILYFATDATYATGSVFSFDGGTTAI
jgi:NAD(P)-dependent dehydrogenase (short-subunit alcohol dehydrogenase family)